MVAGGILDTNTRAKLIQDKLDATWNTVNANADIVYLNSRMEALKQAIINVAGQKGYLEILLEKLGFRSAKSPLEILLNGNENDWIQLEQEAIKSGNTGELLNLYQQVYGLQNTETILNTKMKLRDLIIETASSKDKPGFLTDFARSTLYDSWNAVQLGTGAIEGLQNKLQDYIKQGADKNLIDTLRNASTREDIINFNNTLQQIKMNTIETLGKENFTDTVTKQINMKNIEKANDVAATARNGFIEWFKSLFQ